MPHTADDETTPSQSYESAPQAPAGASAPFATAPSGATHSRACEGDALDPGFEREEAFEPPEPVGFDPYRQPHEQPWAETPHTPHLKPGITSRERTRTSRTCYDLPPPEPDDPLLGFAPVPHVQPRRNSITPDRQRAFIAELAACGIVTQAARRVGISCEAIYNLRNRPGAEEFRAAWELAVDRGVMRVEDGALARAIRGEERMVVSAGKHMGTETRYNDALVMFFLRARRRERYVPRSDDFEALKPGHPVYERIREHVLEVEFGGTEDERYAALDAKIDAMRAREAEAARMLGYEPADHYADFSDLEEDSSTPD